LKAFNRDFDFSAILNPLLAETGPAVTHVQKLARQIARMEKYINGMEENVQADFLRLIPAQTSGGSGCSAAEQLRLQLLGRMQPATGRATAGGGAHFPLSKALFQRKSHQLGALKRYATKDYAT
jgi:hypothetical protein